MKRWSYVVGMPVVVTLFLATACSSNAPVGPTEDEISSALRAQHNRVGHVKTVPNASCDVYYPGNAKPAGHLIADATGIARFHQPPESWGTQLTVKCGDSKSSDITVDLTDPSVFAPPAPPPPKLRPPLTGDPLSYSEDELRAGDYPIRPPTGTPMYDEWLKLVSKPGLGVHQAPTAILGRKNDGYLGSEGSNNWGGLILDGPSSGTEYGWIYGMFYVPTVVANQTYPQNYGSEWIGMGGTNIGGDADNLPQLGASFDYNYECVGHPFQYCNWYTTYTAWAEYYNNSQNQVDLNLTINGGDLLYAYVYPCDFFDHFSTTYGKACFYMEDDSTSTYTSTTLDENPGTSFQGVSAEAIMERPEINGSWYPLTDFSGADMLWVYALDTNGNSHDMTTDNWISSLLQNCCYGSNYPCSLNCTNPYNLASWTSSNWSQNVSFTWDTGCGSQGC